MNRGLLPIGTVVRLKDKKKAVMICGYCPTGPARPGYVYDYSGFPYPEGYGDAFQILQFDSDEIEKLLAMGYQDAETNRYLRALNEKLDDIKKSTEENVEKAKDEMEAEQE